MGYILNDEQKNVVDLARDFAQKEVAPKVKEYDITGEPPVELYQKAFDIGLHALEIPEVYGGSEMDYYTVGAVYEELAKVDAGFATGVTATGLSLKPVLIAGTDEQKKYYSEFIVGEKGNCWGAFALTEPGAGSDASASTTTAVKKGDEYIINGRKCFITNAGFASIFVVFAVTDKEKGAHGISAFIVERNRPGISIGKEEDKMGIRGSNTADVVFEDVHVPADHMLGAEGKGFEIAMKTLDLARPMVGAMAVGIAQRAIEESVNYAKQRITFGKPIIKHQVISFKIADMEMRAETARANIINAVNHYYAGLPFGKQAAIAKCYAGDIAVQNALEAIQILGGYGYSREYNVEKLLRDAKIMQIYEGTNEIQRIVIAGYATK